MTTYTRTHSSARVTWQNGREYHVKNLGWLVKNARYVSVVLVRPLDDGRARLVADGVRNGNRFTYQSDFECHAIAVEWVQRPCLRHANVRIH